MNNNDYILWKYNGKTPVETYTELDFLSDEKKIVYNNLLCKYFLQKDIKYNINYTLSA